MASRALVAAVCALLVFALPAQADECSREQPCPPPLVTDPPAVALLWGDEFNGPAGSQPSTADWRYMGGGSWGNGAELQCYTRRPANVSHDGAGNLAITARYELGWPCLDPTTNYTSARLDTGGRHEFGYGRLEARIKLPHAAAGVWPAFWTLGSDYRDGGFGGSSSWPQCGEIDILEWLGRNPSEARLHLHGQPDAVGDWGPGTSVPGSWAQTWHTYAVDRQPGRIDFFVDGKTVWSQTEADAPEGAWDFDKPMYMLLNVAVGGWAGTPTPAAYPASMLVDYVRAYG
jgi:beta-glucanase (GH16 family)